MSLHCTSPAPKTTLEILRKKNECDIAAQTDIVSLLYHKTVLLAMKTQTTQTHIHQGLMLEKRRLCLTAYAFARRLCLTAYASARLRCFAFRPKHASPAFYSNQTNHSKIHIALSPVVPNHVLLCHQKYDESS